MEQLSLLNIKSVIVNSEVVIYGNNEYYVNGILMQLSKDKTKWEYCAIIRPANGANSITQVNIEKVMIKGG